MSLCAPSFASNPTISILFRLIFKNTLLLTRHFYRFFYTFDHYRFVWISLFVVVVVVNVAMRAGLVVDVVNGVGISLGYARVRFEIMVLNCMNRIGLLCFADANATDGGDVVVRYLIHYKCS